MIEEELAEKIAGYAKIRLCRSAEGYEHPDDWLLAEKDRFTIVKMLRDPKAFADVCLSEENDRLIDALKDALLVMELYHKRDEPNWDRTASPASAIGKARLVLGIKPPAHESSASR